MDYALAKKLKEAGFPQKGKLMYNTKMEAIMFFPTLSELIEAIPKELYFELKWIPNWNVWQAHCGYDSKKKKTKIWTEQKTAEKSVAVLYLAVKGKAKKGKVKGYYYI